VDKRIDRRARSWKVPHRRRVIDRPSDLIARRDLNTARRQAGLGSRRLACRKREPALRIFEAHPAFNDADLGNFASRVDDDQEFGPFDPGGYVRGLDIAWPAGRAKEVDDPARKVG